MYLSRAFCPSHVKSMAAFMCAVLVDRNKLHALSPCAAGHVHHQPASPSQLEKSFSTDLRGTIPLWKNHSAAGFNGFFCGRLAVFSCCW